LAPKVLSSILDLIGETPLVRLAVLAGAGSGDLFAKMETQNPGGSVKDRTALGMLEEGERAGKIAPGGTIVEPTAGNTGIGLAILGARRGYRVVLVVPERFAKEKVILMRALGAEIVRTPTADGMRGAIARAGAIAAETPGAWMPNQFENPGNPEIHYRTTGPEIYRQMDGRVDAVVIGAGTGGTLTGVARYLKERLPRLLAVLVEPAGSVYGGGAYAPYKVEGIGSAFIPEVCDMSLVDRTVAVRDEDSFATIRALARREGILAGGSSGANVFAAIGIARELGPGSRTLTIIPDGPERYLSKDPFGVGETTSDRANRPNQS
jgi:cysteine synthase A